MNGQARSWSASPILPNCIICGAPKAGTSALHLWLSDHPEVLGTSEKETYFFVDPGTHMHRPQIHISNGYEGFSRYVPADEIGDQKILIESTPSYIYYQTAIDTIPQLPTSPRCIFVLREPAQQIYSLFSYFKNNWSWIPSSMGFADFLTAIRIPPDPGVFKGNELAANALANARYVDFLLRWRERIGNERMLVIAYEELRDHPVETAAAVARWLGIDSTFFANYTFPRDNETYMPRSGTLQRVNVSLREKLPKGKLYRLARGLYRRLNTRKPSGATSLEQQIMADLAMEYAEPNARLRREFQLALDGWS